MKVITDINPCFESLATVIDDIARNGVPEDARLIYRARNSVYTLERQGVQLNIKAFRPPSFPNNYVYTGLRKSKAVRSMANARRLTEMGFDTPAPVATIEVREGCRLTRSYYISVQEQVDGDFRLWLDNPVAQTALPALASVLARLHAKGVWHKDFSPGNVMFRKDESAPDGYRMFLIDLNRMQFNVRNQAKLNRNFGTIYVESEDETARFGRLYAAAAGIDENVSDAEARRQHRAYIRRKRLLHALKSAFRH